MEGSETQPAGNGGGTHGHGGQPGVDTPKEPKRKRGPHPDAGKYVVLMAAKPETEGEQPQFQLALPEPFPAEGAKEAKRHAIESNQRVAELVNGDGVLLVAVPAMSWSPTLVRAEQPPPIVKGL